ncbi:MAG: Na+/H+ antiporter [Chloroflexales bacterium]|nr:Na+/H+ antiporter [Chloroflexales bacterium]
MLLTTVVLGLVAAVVGLAILARRLAVPYPVLLVLGGLVLSCVPGLPRVTLDPELVVLLFLPPAIYAQARTTALRDLWRDRGPLALLAVGLVLVTTLTVAVVAHALMPGLPWASAVLLGAIVAPTDTVAASAVLCRLGLSQRLLALIEGEGLLNDAIALVLAHAAVAAVLAGRLNVGADLLTFGWTCAGGIAVGLLAGWLLAHVRRTLDDPPIENTLSLLTPYTAYLCAAWLGASGVLAVVTVGVYLGRRGPRIMSAPTRLRADAIWEQVDFTLNGLIFILIGLQLPSILVALAARGPLRLVAESAALGVTVILIRCAWVGLMSLAPSQRISGRIATPLGWPEGALVAWSGARGIVSLAAALALPRLTSMGQPFPGREQIIVSTFGVILCTLVGQGLSLGPLVRWLGVRDNGAAQTETRMARAVTAQAALAQLETDACTASLPAAVMEPVRASYRARARPTAGRTPRGTRSLNAERQLALRRRLLDVERTRLIQLRDQAQIGDHALQAVQHELDLEQVRLDQLLAHRRGEPEGACAEEVPGLHPRR